MHDIVDLTKKYKGELTEFYMNFGKWKKFRTRYKLQWAQEKFSPENAGNIPETPGIYTFVAKLAPSKLPQHGYIMYVGITGHGNSKHNLRKRYQDYLREQNSERGRPAVVYMLNNWKGDLYFNYVALPQDGVDLEKIEKAFINALLPPVNRTAFSAENSIVKRAAF